MNNNELSLGGACRKCGSPTIKLGKRQSQCTNSDCKFIQS